VYLDSNVFIFGKERPESNSRVILDLIEERKITPIISYATLEELREYFSRKYNRKTAINEVYYVISLPSLEIIPRDRVKRRITRFKGVIPDKDLPHLVSAVIAKVDYIVTYNRHFLESKAKDYVKIIKQAELVNLRHRTPANELLKANTALTFCIHAIKIARANLSLLVSVKGLGIGDLGKIREYRLEGISTA